MVAQLPATKGGVAARPSDRDSVAALIDVGVDAAGVPVLRGVDLVLRAGESVGLVGPNGSGKSSLLRVLATLARPVTGTGHVLGARLGSPEVGRVRPSIALVGHQIALHPRLTLLENMLHIARLTGRPPTHAVHALDLVGLAGAVDRRVAHCSHGMLRRTELARVLLVRPRLLLLDEAHTGLDEASSGLVGAIVRYVCGEGGTSVLVSHDRDRLAEIVDRTATVDLGRVDSQEGRP